MARITVEHLIAADPTGTALLLSASGDTRRLPTSYVTTFAVDGADAAVTLTRAWAGGHAATSAVLTVTWEGGDAGRAAALREAAGAFLARLAAAAEERAYAA